MPQNDNDTRPGLAIITNSITPYGANLHRAIAAGISEFKLHVLVSHHAADFNWRIDYPSDIEIAKFGRVGEHPLENPLSRPWWDFRKGGRFIDYVHRHRVRAVIINGYRSISCIRLMNYLYRQQIPFWVSNDSNIRNEPPLSLAARMGKRCLYAWWLKRATGVMSMGTLGDRFFVKYGANPDRLYRVPCCPDFTPFDRVDEVALEGFRRKFGLNRQRRYLLFCGRLVRLKRVDLLIDAFAALASARPEWDLMIVGDGVLADELRRRVPESLQSRVNWTGFLEGPEIVQAYQAADVLVLPSDSEAWSLVILEAMAAGLAVVSSDVPGAAYDLVEDGRSGRIFPTGNLEELKQALLHVTSAGALQQFKEQSRAALLQWKTATDPVAEIRRALGDAGVLQPLLVESKYPQFAS